MAVIGYVCQLYLMNYGIWRRRATLYRECYAELGISRLQAESQARDAEKQMMMLRASMRNS